MTKSGANANNGDMTGGLTLNLNNDTSNANQNISERLTTYDYPINL